MKKDASSIRSRYDCKNALQIRIRSSILQMSKRLWRCFTKSIICSTSELNDNKKNLHALRWNRKTEKCQFNSHLFDNRSLNHVRKRLSQWHVNRQLTLYDTIISYWHSSNRHSIETSNRSFFTWQFNSFFVSLVLFDHTSMKKLKTRAYTRDKRDESQLVNQLNAKQLFCWHLKSRSLMQKLSIRSFHHLLSNLQSESHLIVNDLHRMFFEKSKSMNLQQHQMRACFSCNSDKCNLQSNDYLIQTRVTSYLNVTILFAFETIEFEIFKSTHARENLSRQFAILIHFSIFRFSTLFNSFQFADVVKSISSSIYLAVDSHRSSRELKAVKYSWKSLLWRSIDLKKF